MSEKLVRDARANGEKSPSVISTITPHVTKFRNPFAALAHLNPSGSGPANSTISGQVKAILTSEPGVRISPLRGRQEKQKAGHLCPRIRDKPSSKRPWTSPPSCTAEIGLRTKKEEEKKERAIFLSNQNIRYYKFN